MLNGRSSTSANAAPPAAGPTSLDTWQQFDTSPSDRERRELDELLARYSRRPTAAELFGTTPIPPAELDAAERWQWRQLAEAIPPPAEYSIDPELAAPPSADELAQLRAELAERPELARLLTPAQRDALAPPIEAAGTDKLLRNDAAKVELGRAIGAGAAELWQRGELAPAVWLEKRQLAMSGCRTVRAFRDAICGSYLARPNSCRVRVCPDCERARSARLAERFAGLSVDMRRPIFWTFTVPNVPADQLVAGVDWLLEAFRRLRRRAMFTGGKCRGDPGCAGHEAAAGGVYAIEVTWSSARSDWHPHIHALIDLPFVRWAEMRSAWRAVTCDAIRYLEAGGGRVKRCRHSADESGRPLGKCRGASVLWVEAVKGEPGSPERVAAIRETLKYTVGGLVKSDGTLDGAPDARLTDLLLALRNRRLVAGWGEWRNVVDADPEDELPDTLRGEDVAPELRGLPVHCPACGAAALWELPVDIPRRACYLARDGTLRWRPPPAASS